MSEKKGSSLADKIFIKLEEDILSEKYKAGEVLTEMKLSEELGVSRTPIREALSRLEQEELITFLPKGIKVLGVSLEDLKDIYDIRIAIEGMAAEKAAEKMSDAQLKEIEEIVELQEFYTKKNDADRIKNMDTQFHEYIYSNCDSPIFLTTLSLLHKKIQKFRRLSVENHKRAKDAVKEHREILNALKKHNSQLAKQLTEQHIKNAKNNIIGGK